MNEDDDYIPSVTESDPVSDIDPEEMARLMADIGNVDDDLLGGKRAEVPKKGAAAESSKKESTVVSSQKKLDKEDWDDSADDILKSDEDIRISSSDTKKESVPGTPARNEQTTPTGKKHLMSALFESSPKDSKPFAELSDLSKDKVELELSDSKNSKKVESKASASPSSMVTGGATEKKPEGSKKIKEVSFDDDDGGLLNLERTNKSSYKTQKSSDSGFLDSLLQKGSTSSKQESKAASKEFILPDKYKSPSSRRNDITDSVDRGYQPSSVSPQKNQGQSTVSSSLDELFSSDNSRVRRRTPPSRKNTPFEIDDDDIIGPVKARQGKVSVSDEKNLESIEIVDNSRKPSRQDDWLFNSSPQESSPQKKDSVSRNSSYQQQSQQSQKEDWLNQLLSADKSPPKSHKHSDQSPMKSSNSPATPAETTHNLQGSAVSSIGMSVLSVDHARNSALVHSKLKADMDAQMAAMSSIIHAQQQQAESQLMQYLQLHMQEQQNKFAQFLAQQNQMSLSSLPFVNNRGSFAVEDEETVKKLKVELHKANTESASREIELAILRKQHEHEIEIIEAAHRKKLDIEKEVWNRTEERMKDERENLIENHEKKIREIQKDKEDLILSYETSVSAMKMEWGENLARTKELYNSVIERMKKEHQQAIERLTDLKNVELQAVISAAGKTREAEAVFDQLQTNTESLTKLTNCVQERNESAFELTKKTLQMREKQLKEMDSMLSVARAEAESERNRLTVLVSRLESNLANQGTEVESERWKLSQERMKFEVEKKALEEERKQFVVLMENDRRELAQAKQNFWSEQKELMQCVAKQKSEVSALQSQLSNRYSTGLESEFNLTRLHEEKRLLEEKVLSLKLKKEELLEEQYRAEENRIILRNEQEKLQTMKELNEREKEHLAEKIREIEQKEERLEQLHHDSEKKLADITLATQDLHYQQDAIAKERSRLQQEEFQVQQFIRKGLCPTCRRTAVSDTKGFIQNNPRLPGDGGEVMNISYSAAGIGKKWERKNFDPASVMERLRSARHEETKLKEKLQMSFLSSS